MAPQLLLFCLRQVLVDLDAWAVFDQLLLGGTWTSPLPSLAWTMGTKLELVPNKPALTKRPLRHARLVVHVDILDAANTAGDMVDHGAVPPARNGLNVGDDSRPSCDITAQMSPYSGSVVSLLAGS